MPRKLIVSAALLGTLVATQASIVYRWVDDQGHTHVSDVVPTKYKKSAKAIDSSQFEVSPERKKQADEHAAREKAAAEDATGQKNPGSPASPPKSSSASDPAGFVKRPAQGVTDSTDCGTWRRLYAESQACFGPYRNATGGIKSEAFERCTEIPSPDYKCGPLRY